MSLFLGFDTDQAPTREQLIALYDGGMRNCVYYLEAPSHSNAGYMGRRAELLSLSQDAEGNANRTIYPIATYVGQQSVGRGSHIVTGAQGEIDGKDCAAKMASEGFPPGSDVYLDCEEGLPLTTARIEYTQFFAIGVRLGGYVPKAYSTHAMMTALEAACPALEPHDYTFRVPTTALTHASLPLSGADAPPEDMAGSGVPDAQVWQYRQNVQLAFGGDSLLVDLDVSLVADPSAP